MERKSIKFYIPWIFVFLFLSVTVYLYMQLPRGDNLQGKQEEATRTIEAVGKLVVLPEEVPTVATVTDLELLKDQVFFKNAKVGDKVLIYLQAQKAILYNPESNKIIELAPLNAYSQKSSNIAK